MKVLDSLVPEPTHIEKEPLHRIEIEPDATSLTLLQQVYRNPKLPLPTRIRAATAALPHEHPKLAVTAVVSEGDFADQLEKAVERSRKVSPMIEVTPQQATQPILQATLRGLMYRSRMVGSQQYWIEDIEVGEHHTMQGEVV